MTDSDLKLVALFFGLCVPLRIGMVLLVALLYDEFKYVLITILSIQIAGFLLSDILKREKTALNNDKWWTSTHHAFLYGLTVLGLSLEWKFSFIILLIDVFYGVTNWTIHHKLK